MNNFDTKHNERAGPMATAVDHAGYLRDRWARATRDPFPEQPWTDEMGHLKARVDHGMWIVDCPCNNAAVVDLNHPFFICAVCLTGAWYVVDLPAELADIEAVLLERTAHSPVLGWVNRNWSPGESVEDLLEENVEHGVDIPIHLAGRFLSNGG